MSKLSYPVCVRSIPIFGFVILSFSDASACRVNLPKPVLHSELPSEAHEVDFIGLVKNISNRRSLLTREYKVKYRIIESETHPGRVGQLVLVNYQAHTCGPRSEKGNTGYLIGRIEGVTWRGRLRVEPVYWPLALGITE